MLLWSWTNPAWACSVCFSATEQNSQAFVDTTIFLSLLPLVAIGVGAWWLHRQYATA